MSTSESNPLKRKVYFANTNKHIKLENDISNTNIDEDEQQDSVTLELDVTPGAPLLKKMYKPIISNYIEYYDNEELRQILIEKPYTSMKLLGEPVFEYIVPLFTNLEFYNFIYNCYDFKTNYQEKKGDSFLLIKDLAKSDEIVMKLIKIISNNFEKYVASCYKHYISHRNLDSVDFEHFNKEMIMKCVQQNGIILKLLSNDLRSDREIVLEAVKSDGLALEFASMELQSDEEIVKAAISGNGSALDFASDELKAKQSLQLLALKKLYHNIPKCIIQDIDDREFILQAVKNYPNIIRTVRTEFKSDREIVLAAVQQHGCWLEYASKELKLDRELVLLSIKNSVTAPVPSEFYSDREIMLAAIRTD